MSENVTEAPPVEKKSTGKTEAEKKKEVDSLEAALDIANESGPDENINDADDTAPGPGPDTLKKDKAAEPNPINDWFNGQGFVNELMVELGVFMLTTVNIKAFNAIYANKYKPLAEDCIEIDEDGREIIDKGLQGAVPGVYAWAKRQNQGVIGLLYMEYCIIKDMKNSAELLDVPEKPPKSNKASFREPVDIASVKSTVKKPVDIASATTTKEKAEPKPVNITMPKFNDKESEVWVEKWHKKKGDPVKKGEVMAEVGNNDDIDKSIKAPVDGILTAIYYKANQPFITGDRIAQITPSAPASEAKG